MDTEIVGLLPNLSPSMTLSEALKEFNSLVAQSKKWCVNPTKEAGLRRNLTPQEQTKFAQNDLALSGLLGCNAWYTMTDRTPEIDIAYTRHTIDPSLSQGVQCVSVGFLQPYILAAHSNCDKLTVVDLSFRTLRLHALMLPLLTAKNFAGIDVVIETWEKQSGVKLSEVCTSYSLSRCKIELMAFAEKYRSGINVELTLSSLTHFKGDFNQPTIFYSSNALDPNFTTADEFKKIQANWMTRTAPFYVIYHQAESSNFGVYKLTKQTIQKICADNFIVARSGHYSKDGCKYFPATRSEYTTYFDNAATNKEEKLPCRF
ncbi:MAG TPA: hypothetical protein PLY93_09530 [Turneriella sp.]|nr:hypothetical protein [Turneriella sp.]